MNKQTKEAVIKHYFGFDNVEVADDLNDIRGLDNFEIQLDRNIHDFYRPSIKGPKCMEDDVLLEMFKYFNNGRVKIDYNKYEEEGKLIIDFIIQSNIENNKQKMDDEEINEDLINKCKVDRSEMEIEKDGIK